MYGLGNPSDFRETEGTVVFLTPRKRSEVWLCKPVAPVAKVIDAKGFLWGMVFKFMDFDGAPITVAVNRKLINSSGVLLAKGFATLGLSINPGYEKQFSVHLSTKLESVKNKETIAQVSDMCRLET